MGPVLGTLLFADSRRRINDELSTTGNEEICILLMHAHVNEIPKNDHDVNVTGHVYFLFSVAKDDKGKVHKCQREPSET